MLRELNRFTQKHGNIVFLVLLLVLVGPLIFLFGSDGCNQNQRGLFDGDSYGMLGEEVVTSANFQHHMYAEVMQYYLTSGKLVNLNGLMRSNNAISDFKTPVLLRMRALLFAKERGFDQVTDVELGKYKAKQKAFQNDKGEFVADKYRIFINGFFEKQPITVLDFDQMCRENIVIERLKRMLDAETTNVAAVRASILSTGGKAMYTLKEFNRSNYSSLEISDEEIKAVYDEQKETTYLVPEKRIANVVAFQVQETPEGAKPVTDADVKTYYETNSKTYTTEAEVRASHILISYKGASRSQQTRTEAEAKELAEKVLKEVNAKDASFAKLAAQYSDGPSKDNGGDVNFFRRKGQMAEPFANAAFKLKRGEISDLVKSDFGYHIIKKTAEKPASLRPFDDVKSSIRARLVNENNNALFDVKAQEQYTRDLKSKYSQVQATIKYMGITKGDSTDEKELKLDKETAEAIRKEALATKDLEKFAAATQKKYPKMKFTQGKRENIDVTKKDEPEYIKKGFELKTGAVSELIEEPDAFFIVQKVSERSQQPFSEVKQAIVGTLRSQARNKAKAMAKGKAMAFLTALGDKGLSGPEAIAHFEAVANAQKVTTVELPALSQDDKHHVNDLLGGFSASTMYNGIKALTPANPYSTVFSDSKNAYVACLKEIQAPRAPELTDVHARIYGDILEKKSLEAARNAAEKLRKELTEKLEKGLTPKELKTFRKPRDYPNPQYTPDPDKTAQQLSYRTKTGAISIGNIDRGAVLVYMEGRELQDEKTLNESFDRQAKDLTADSNQMQFFRYYQGERGIMLLADHPFIKSLETSYPFTVAPGLEDMFADKQQP
ncbi:hypothetical protein BVX99_01320 [bacterium F16]|nr:hypothetical protein BVX99_01320 [bacterium F16]